MLTPWKESYDQPRQHIKKQRHYFASKEIQPVHPKGNQSWIFIGMTDAVAEAPILWPPDVKNGLIGKDPAAGKDWRQEEKGMTGWDGWMASLTRWTWVCVSSQSWWWTEKPGMLQSLGLQRGGHDWVTELNELMFTVITSKIITKTLNLLNSIDRNKQKRIQCI